MQVTLTPVVVGALTLILATLMLLPMVVREALQDRRRRKATDHAPAPRGLILDDSGRSAWPMARRVRQPSQRTHRAVDPVAPIQPIDRVTLTYDSEWYAAGEVMRGRFLDVAAGVALLVLLSMVW